VRAVLTARQ
jgi:hypothetical protein